MVDFMKSGKWIANSGLNLWRLWVWVRVNTIAASR